MLPVRELCTAPEHIWTTRRPVWVQAWVAGVALAALGALTYVAPMAAAAALLAGVCLRRRVFPGMLKPGGWLGYAATQRWVVGPDGHGMALRRVWRAPGWITLDLQPLQGAARGTVLTIWRGSVPADTWSRLQRLAARAVAPERWRL